MFGEDDGEEELVLGNGSEFELEDNDNNAEDYEDDDNAFERGRSGDKGTGDGQKDKAGKDSVEAEGTATGKKAGTEQGDVDGDGDEDEGSRSARRIRDLANALKRQEQATTQTVAELRRDLELRDELRKKEAELAVRENVLSQQKQELQSTLADLNRQRRLAIEDQNWELETKLNDKILDAKLRVMATETDISSIESAREQLGNVTQKGSNREQVQATTQAAPNPMAKEFVDRNPWILNRLTGEEQTALAHQMELYLKKPGVDVNDKKTWDQIASIVETFAKNNDLPFSVDTGDGSKSGRKNAAPEENRSKSKPKSNQSGSDRGTSEHPIQTKTKDGKVKLKVTPDDKEMAQQLGISVYENGEFSPRFKAYMKERARTDDVLKKQAETRESIWTPLK